MKKLTLLLAALLACAALTVTALAAGPALTVNGDGVPTVSDVTGSRTFLAAYATNTGRFLGIASTQEGLTRNTALKAIQLNANFAPQGAARSVLVITEPGSTVSGGAYDQVVVTRAVGSGAVSLFGVSVSEGVTVWGGSSLTLNGCAVSKVTVNTARLAITTSGTADSVSVFTDSTAAPTVTVNGVTAQICRKSQYSNVDIFGRPVIRQLGAYGTVTETVDRSKLLASYTKGVSGRTLYNLLGADRIGACALTYRVDGVPSDVINQSNVTNSNTANYPTTGKGVLTEVYAVGNNLLIVSVNTYMAKASADYNAARDELKIYTCNTPDAVACERPGTYGGRTITAENAMKRVLKTVRGESFPNVRDYKKDTPLMVTVASADGGATYHVQSVEVATFTQDAVITKYSSLDPQSNYLVTGGEQKDYSKNIFLAPYDSGRPNPLRRYSVSSLTDYTYNIFYDKYGYVLGVEVYRGEEKYVFLTAFKPSATSLAPNEGIGYLIFRDGTTKTAKIDLSETNENIAAYAARTGNPANGYVPLNASSKSSATGAQYNMWFTYEERNGVYTLEPVDYWLVRANQPAAAATQGSPTKPIVINPAAAAIDAEYGRTGSSLKRGYGINSSTYITVESDVKSCDNASAGNRTIKKVNGVYSGTQNVALKPFPETDEQSLGTVAFGTIPATANDHAFSSAGDVFAVLDANGYIIAAIVVGKVSDTSNFAQPPSDRITVTSASGRYGAPKAGDALQIFVPAAASWYVSVSVVVNGSVTPLGTFPITSGVMTTLSITVAPGAVYQVAECSASGTVVSGGLTGSGTGVN